MLSKMGSEMDEDVRVVKKKIDDGVEELKM